MSLLFYSNKNQFLAKPHRSLLSTLIYFLPTRAGGLCCLTFIGTRVQGEIDSDFLPAHRCSGVLLIVFGLLHHAAAFCTAYFGRCTVQRHFAERILRAAQGGWILLGMKGSNSSSPPTPFTTHPNIKIRWKSNPTPLFPFL